MAISKTQWGAIVVVVIVIVAVVAVAVVYSGDEEEEEDETEEISSNLETRLNIMGNANLDSYLDESDIELIQDIIDGNAEETELADANNDGVIDENDIEQVREVMNFTADEIWYWDVNGNVAHIVGPIESVAVQYWPTLQAFIAIGAYDLVDYCDSSTLSSIESGVYGQAMIDQGAESFGSGFQSNYDFEVMMSLGVDAIACGSANIYFVGIEDMYSDDAYINMIRLPFWEENYTVSAYITLAYILNEEEYVEKAYEYLDFTEDVLDVLDEHLADVTDKKTVLVCYYDTDTTELEVEIECRGSGSYECSVMAGLDNLASYINTDGVLSSDTMYYYTDVEFIYAEDPDYIIMLHGSGLNRTVEDQQEAYETWSTYLTETRAYQDGNILVSGSGITSGLYQTVLALMIACEVYPDEFSDVDAYEYLQYLMDNFTVMNLGISSDSDDYYDVTEQGAFLYRGQN